jgi:hypothetical protein
VTYRPISRYEVAGGYLNLSGLAGNDPASPARPDTEETQ